MSKLRELYQEIILDHYKRPRNFHPMEGADRTVKGLNPLCGDQVTVYLKLNGDTVEDISFEGAGCAICTASASLMTESVKGKTGKGVMELFKTIHGLLTTESDEPPAGLGKLSILSVVREYPVRVKCAALPWHTLHAALENRGEGVSTE